MKIQLDTTNKTIKIEEAVNLKELFEFLEQILPDGLWKTFKLETNTVINWNSSPVIIDRTYPYAYPFERPWIYYDNSTIDNRMGAQSYIPGTYNFEIK